MNPITLMIFIIVPSTSALVDCRTACRTCRQKIDTSSLLEVYCAMCEECKLRRRERLRSRTDEGNQNKSHEVSKDITQYDRTTKTHGQDSAPADKEYQHNLHSHEIAAPLSQGQYRPIPQASYPENPPAYIQDPYSPGAYKLQPPPHIYYPVSYPSGCPTPPQCSESEEEYNPQQLSMQTEKITLPTTTTTTITTTTSTTTTTTKQPCPRIAHCKKKRKRPRIQYATRPVPEIRYIPQPPPPPHYIPQPYPCMSPCVPPMLGPSCPCPLYQPPLINLPPYQPFPPINLPSYQPQTERTYIQPLYLPDRTRSQHPTPVISTTTEQKSTTKNFFYVYLGVPKKVLSF